MHDLEITSQETTLKNEDAGTHLSHIHAELYDFFDSSGLMMGIKIPTGLT